MLQLTLAVVLLLMSVVIHEAGHWMLLRRFGVPVTSYGIGLGPDFIRIGRFRVGMLPIGASLTPDPVAFAQLPALRRVWVALAGPWMSALYATLLLVSAYALGADGVAGRGLILLSNLNWLLAGVNLMPVPPLDGFRALDYWLEHRGRHLSAKVRSVAYRAGNGLVYGFGFAAISLALTGGHL